jgi:hypothetical protein
MAQDTDNDEGDATEVLKKWRSDPAPRSKIGTLI